MKDERKTKKELIDELQRLRMRISRLEAEADSDISKKLAEKEKYYRLLLNRLHEDIMVIDREYRVTDINTTFLSTTGQRREDVIGRYCYQVSHGYNQPCDLEGEECPLKTVFDTGEAAHCVHQHTMQDGSKIWADLLFSPMKDESGKVTHVIESARDVTRLKLAEEALAEKEERLSTLFRKANDGIVLFDAETGSILQSNERFEKLTGRSAEQLREMKIWEIRPLDKQELARREFFAVKQTGANAAAKVEIQKPNGTIFPIEFEGKVHHILGKRVFQSFARDITARQEAEQALKQSEERYRELVEKAGIAIMIDDLQGNFSYFNKQFCDLFGYTTGEMRKQSIRSLVHPEDRERVESYHTGRLKGKRVPSRYEFRGIRKDGTIVYLEVEAVPLKENGKIVGSRSYMWDISDRKQAELALQENEERFRMVVENSHDGILIVDDAYTILYANRQLCSILGRSKKELLGHDFREFLDGKTRQLVAERYRRRQRGEKVTSRYEFPVTRKDGEKRLVEMKVAVIQDAQGRANTVAHLLDITASRKAETALKESRQQFKTLFESAPDAYYLHDLDGVFLSANTAAENLTGYHREELSGKSLPESGLLSEEQIPGALEILAKNRQGHAAGPAEFILTRKDGQRMAIEIRTVPSKLGDKPVVLGIARDVSDRKRTEAQVLQLASVIDQATESVVITDLDGNIEYVNPAFTRLTGYHREEVMGKNPRILKSGEHSEAFYRELWETITGGNNWRGTFINRRKDGSTYFEDAVITPVKDESGKIISYAGIKRDITREKKLEDQLRQAQKMEAIGRLAGGVAHDFNNLLTVINGYSELLLKKLEPGAPFHKEISQIKSAGDRAGLLTDQLLAFSRRQVIQPKILNLNSVVENSSKMLRRLIGEDIDLATVLASELGNVKIDPGQIEQIILNLAVNARDAMPRGGKMTIETTNFEIDDSYLKEHVEIQKGWYVMLAVSDTGIGMSKEIQSHIFEPFFTTKEHGKGTGLGLSTVYGIVKQNNGYIWVYSEPDKGTTFKIYLPMIHESVLVEQEERQVVPEALRGDETILLVEDDKNVRQLAVRILREKGYSVLEAEDGFQALQVSHGHKGKIHLLLSDVVMPSMSGKELAEKMEILYRGIKVVFFSGYTDNAIMHHRVLEPGTAFIQKPFNPLHLLMKIREVLDRK